MLETWSENSSHRASRVLHSPLTCRTSCRVFMENRFSCGIGSSEAIPGAGCATTARQPGKAPGSTGLRRPTSVQQHPRVRTYQSENHKAATCEQARSGTTCHASVRIRQKPFLTRCDMIVVLCRIVCTTSTRKGAGLDLRTRHSSLLQA